MFPVTAAELKSALAKLPAPDSVPGAFITVPIPVFQEVPDTLAAPLRELTFRKCVRGNGDDDPWHNEWELEFTSRLEPSAPTSPLDELFEDIEIASDDEFDSLVDWLVVVEQQSLLNIAEGIVGDMDIGTAETVSGWCFDHILRLEADMGDDVGCIDERAGRPGGRTYDVETAPDTVEEADLDYFEISKGIREAMKNYNIAVFNARHDAGIEVKARTIDHGLLDVINIKLELAL